MIASDRLTDALSDRAYLNLVHGLLVDHAEHIAHLYDQVERLTAHRHPWECPYHRLPESKDHYACRLGPTLEAAPLTPESLAHVR